MPRRRYDVTPVPGVDLDAAPASYWDDVSPLDALVRNITGQNRRELVRDIAGGGPAAALGPVDDTLLADTLHDDDRRALGRLHPSFLGGEFLPHYAAGEAEIARIVLDSVTRDVIAVRARRARAGGRLRYRIVDEYGATFDLAVRSSAHPLTLRQLIQLIETATSDDLGFLSMPMPYTWLEWQAENGEAPDPSFVQVESTQYDGLATYYDARLGDYARSLGWTDDDETGDGDEGDGSDGPWSPPPDGWRAMPGEGA
jgi:hypothetical protein